MSMPKASSDRSGDPFHTTRWSLVLAVGDDSDATAETALETLCQTYWFPLYAYVRRRVADVHEARDLTQGFFERVLEKRTIENANPDRGRFRAFLLTACKRFLANEWKKGQAAKRGGGTRLLSLDFDLAENRYQTEAVESLTPEIIYEQQWAMTLLASVLTKLRTEYANRDKTELFDCLKSFLSGSGSSVAHRDAAVELDMSEGAIKVAAHRLRTRYRELIRSEIGETVESKEDVEDEIRRLFEVLAQNHGNSL